MPLFDRRDDRSIPTRLPAGEARGAAFAQLERDPARLVMMLSLRAGGVGLNLTAASAVFHDRWWNAAAEAQAEDRARRIRRTRAVRTVAYLCLGTVEARIARRLAEKRALFADLVEDVGVTGLRGLDFSSLL